MLLSSVTLKKVKEGEVTAGAQSRPGAAARCAPAKRSLARCCCCCHGRTAPTAWEETRHVSRSKEKVGIFSKGDVI